MDIRKELKQIIDASPWGRRSVYSVTSELSKVLSYFRSYHIDGETLDDDALIKAMTPEFQRDNDQWTQEIQQGFVEAIICGCPTELILYSLKDEDGFQSLTECYLLDGLQRSTAISDWQNGKFKAFGYDVADLSHRAIMKASRITIRVMTFDSHEDACEFYIKFNRGSVAHTDSAFDKAEKWLNRNA
ncbi:hypothetical protein [Vibrio barjaei]|uniref:hypothetical protein n=1 Tax=Vibrio barjaei TaxID=1676683 RepID=UPI00228338C6|nr:hypothetical protein [Vibrio barjaei]MCY9874619.1 hypothetical protein [Vibrio barjaei]